ncbi:MAG: outer membrane beta-barrel protein [Pseudobdellovibrionaceae bacterium]|jgi:hypothetical protein|nr:outer membrane beta-barrel protein [Pseudobdellovibrionaceae bacterium]
MTVGYMFSFWKDISPVGNTRIQALSSVATCALLLASFVSVGQSTAAEYNEIVQKSQEQAGQSDQVHGIRVGGFLLLPALGIKAEYDDNIDNVRNNKKEDIITTTSGSLALKSNWNRHMVMLGTNQRKVTYKERDTRDSVTGSYFISGRYDIAKETSLSTSFTHGKSRLNRGAGSDTDVNNPIDYWIDTATLGFKRTLGYIQFAMDGRHIVSTVLDKAKALGTDYEKKTSDGIGGTVSYVRSPGNSLYLRTNFTKNDYSLINGTTRETDLWDARTGMTFYTGGLYAGGLYAGWQKHREKSTEDERNLFSFGGNLRWNITRLTSLNYSYDKGIREGEAAANDTAEITTQQLTLSNSFTRLWGGSISLRQEDYKYDGIGNASDSTIYIGKIENSYALTDSLDVNVGIAHQKRDAIDRDSEYKSNSVYISLTYIH